jgi:hypothetical protein
MRFGLQAYTLSFLYLLISFDYLIINKQPQFRLPIPVLREQASDRIKVRSLALQEDHAVVRGCEIPTQQAV